MKKFMITTIELVEQYKTFEVDAENVQEAVEAFSDYDENNDPVSEDVIPVDCICGADIHKIQDEQGNVIEEAEWKS